MIARRRVEAISLSNFLVISTRASSGKRGADRQTDMSCTTYNVVDVSSIFQAHLWRLPLHSGDCLFARRPANLRK